MSRVTMSRAPMMGKVVTSARQGFNIRCSSFPWLVRCYPRGLSAVCCRAICRGETRGDQPTRLRDGAGWSLLQEMRSRILEYRCHNVKSGASLSNVATISSSKSIVMLTLSLPKMVNCPFFLFAQTVLQSTVFR